MGLQENLTAQNAVHQGLVRNTHMGWLTGKSVRELFIKVLSATHMGWLTGKSITELFIKVQSAALGMMMVASPTGVEVHVIFCQTAQFRFDSMDHCNLIWTPTTILMHYCLGGHSTGYPGLDICSHSSILRETIPVLDQSSCPWWTLA